MRGHRRPLFTGREGVTWFTFEILGPIHISGPVIAIKFKFGMQMLACRLATRGTNGAVDKMLQHEVMLHSDATPGEISITQQVPSITF